MSLWEDGLEKILASEEKILSLLQDESKRKTQALKTADIVSIDAIVNREQMLAMQLGAAEENRLKLLREAGMEALPLSGLIGQAETGNRESLARRLKEMQRLTARLGRQNRLNNELCRTRLEFYEFARGIRNATYQQDGRAEKEQSPSSLMDQKI